MVYTIVRLSLIIAVSGPLGSYFRGLSKNSLKKITIFG